MSSGSLFSVLFDYNERESDPPLYQRTGAQYLALMSIQQIPVKVFWLLLLTRATRLHIVGKIVTKLCPRIRFEHFRGLFSDGYL